MDYLRAFVVIAIVLYGVGLFVWWVAMNAYMDERDSDLDRQWAELDARIEEDS